MTSLPVREMVLYKHGVGFFVREGTFDGSVLNLNFREDEINDVLKSLAVFDKAGGQVLGVHYPTPIDLMTRLSESTINLSDQSTLFDLLTDLRGRVCTLTFETTPGTLETLTGRIVGLDHLEQRRRQLGIEEKTESSLVSLLTEKGVRVFKLADLRGIVIEDEQSARDLSYFLDITKTKDSRRQISVQLSEGSHNLAVYYVAPSPTWRVSYRLVAAADEDGQAGRALIQGWGLFDNRLEEDLENIRLTLVAGQPISFIYDLYTSQIPRRPTVKDESRIAPGPIEFDAETEDLPDARLREFAEPSAGTFAMRRAMPAAENVQAASYYAMTPAKKAFKPAVETKTAGETFQYIVTSPVTVKRGESALVPIINNEVRYTRELLYNKIKLANHPVAALRFENTTGLTFERGPVTVVEDGDYKGEAVLPLTKEAGSVYLPYAVELGIRISERDDFKRQTMRMEVKGRILVQHDYDLYTRTYLLENTLPRPAVVTLEVVINPQRELIDTPPPTIQTAAERRWQLEVPARSKGEFILKERGPLESTLKLEDLTLLQLQKFLSENWLDQALFDRLAEILQNFDLIKKTRAKIDAMNIERSEIYQTQEHLRANIAALQPTGQEAILRGRLLQQLESTQDRLESIDRETAAAKLQVEAAEKKTEVLVSALEKKES